MSKSQPEKIYSLALKPAKCAVDLGVGSERAEYVDQDYILEKLGRPHRNINLMYCYYPLDEGWPARASDAFENESGQFVWDYPYDDYFPYQGGPNGDTSGEPFKYMREIRQRGQDVKLTLTIDCGVPEEDLIKIAEELKTFGRMHLRINHEATGSWFAFNKRYSYQEVGDFFVKFHKIIKKIAPNVLTVICIGGVEKEEEEKIVYEEEFKEAVKVADIWSVDRYLALHWGFPFDIAERGGGSHNRLTVDMVHRINDKTFKRYKYLNDDQAKPFVISEFNADGDVLGPYEQAKMIKEYYMNVKENEDSWLTGITYYQFRDRGRLGLEIENPNNSSQGIVQKPMMDTYKEIISDDYFKPVLEIGEEKCLPYTLRWGSAEDAEGISIPVELEKAPVFCELYFEEELNLLIEFNGRWFYKAPGTKMIDLMPAFYENPIDHSKTIKINIFAPPATGENDPTQGDDWAENYYCKIKEIPKIRIRYEAIETSYFQGDEKEE